MESALYEFYSLVEYDTSQLVNKNRTRALSMR